MEISVDFDDGRVREFNTAAYITNEGFAGMAPEDPAARNFVTEFEVRLDKMGDESGLWLEVYYNTLNAGNEKEVDLSDRGIERPVPAATHRIGGVVCILSAEEFRHAVLILVRRCGEVVTAAWRQGSGMWLINGQRFAVKMREIYSDANTTSKNAQELQMVGYLRNAYPTAREEDLVAATGYPYDAFLELRELELRNVEGLSSEEPPGDGVDFPAPVDAPGFALGDDGADSLIPDGVEFDEDDE